MVKGYIFIGMWMLDKWEGLLGYIVIDIIWLIFRKNIINIKNKILKNMKVILLKVLVCMF